MRQNIYLRALKTLPHLEIIFGQFKKRHINLSLAIKNPHKLKQVKKIIGNNINPFFKYEEKETDVNIATHIIYDCCKEDISSIAILSNDTDLKLPLWYARKKLKKRVLVITPIGKESGSIVSLQGHQDLKKVSNKTISLTEENLKKCQFPETMTDDKGEFFCPPKWKQSS